MTTYYLHSIKEDLQRLYTDYQKPHDDGKSWTLPHFFPKEYSITLPVGEISALVIGTDSVNGYTSDGYPTFNGFTGGFYFEPSNPNANALHDGVDPDVVLGIPVRLGMNVLSGEYVYNDGEEEQTIPFTINFNVIPEENHGPVTMTNFNPGDPT
jgi:hypothetical protein